MCYYFDYTMETIDINVRYISLDKKLQKYFLIYDISHKTTFMGPILLRIRFGEIDRFRYLVLFSFLYDEIWNRIKYLISEKRGIKDSINYHFAKIRIDSYNYLPLEKILTFHNVIILIKSVVNENKNKYYYNIFLEKGSYIMNAIFL